MEGQRELQFCVLSKSGLSKTGLGLESVLPQSQDCSFGGPHPSPWDVIISPKAVVTEESCVLFATIFLT